MIKRPRKQFDVQGLTLTTSSWTQQKETDWCVGVGSSCDCHQVIGDSKTRKVGLTMSNSEFVSLLAAVK